MRLWTRKIHLWAALIGAVPALLLCLSGLILAFEPELQAWEERDHARVDAAGVPLPPDRLLTGVESATGQLVSYYRIPREPTQAAFIGTVDDRYHFVNPYDGTILHSTETPAFFMRAVRSFHTSFFMGEFGTWLAVISSCILILLTLTGCFLFLKRRLTFRTFWKVRWHPLARRHYDLHAVVGFATAVPILLITLSGVLIGLGAIWRDTILAVTNSTWKARPTLVQPVERADWNFDYTAVINTVEQAAPADMFIDGISFPQDAENPLLFRLLYPWATRPASWAFVNPADGALLDFHHHWDLEPGHLIHRLNRGFHSGELYTDAMRWLWLLLMAVPFLLAYTGYRQWRRIIPSRDTRKP